MVRDPHEVLGVNRDADDDEIRRARRRLVKKLHPDVGCGSSEEEFRDVQDAYDTLIDPEKRQSHDRGQGVMDSPAEDWGTAWHRGGPFPEGYHLDLRNLHARRRAEPAFAYRRREASGARVEDPFASFRRYFESLDLWLSDDWW